MQTEQENPLDLVWGIEDIAKLIGRTERQTQNMLATGALPARRVGGRWVTKRAVIVKFFEEIAA